jgi:hypothetical protein
MQGALELTNDIGYLSMREDAFATLARVSCALLQYEEQIMGYGMPGGLKKLIPSSRHHWVELLKEGAIRAAKHMQYHI